MMKMKKSKLIKLSSQNFKKWGSCGFLLGIQLLCLFNVEGKRHEMRKRDLTNGDDCPGSNEQPNIQVVRLNGGPNLNSSVQEDKTESWNTFRPLILICSAAYPITWEFDGNKPPDLSVETRVKTDDVFNPRKTCYTSTMKVLASGYTGRESRTGNYTCRGMTNPNKIASIYRYAYDGTTVFNTKKTVDSSVMLAGPGQPKVNIPCASNVGNHLNATLFGIDDEGNFTAVSDKVSVVYDPKAGFELSSINGKEEDLVGNYVCMAIYRNKTEVVEATVNPEPRFIAKPKRKYVNFVHKMLTLSCRAKEAVQIKLINTNVQIQHHARELRYKQATRYKFGAVADLIVHPSQTVLKGQAQCVSKDTNEILWTWEFDTDQVCNCTWYPRKDTLKVTRFFFLLDRSFRGAIHKLTINTEGDSYFMNLPTPRGELVCRSPSSPRVNLTFIRCENHVECKIKSSFLQWFEFDSSTFIEGIFAQDDPTKIRNVNENGTSFGQSYIRSGIIKCGVGNYLTTKIALANLDSLYIDEMPMTGFMRVVAPETNVFVGDKMLFTCAYDKFQISREAKWGFKFKNGTIKFIDDEIPQIDDRTSLDLEKYLRSTFIKITSPEIEELMCFAPKWNSTEWKNASLALNVANLLPVTPGSPENCPISTKPTIILQRNSSASIRRIRLPHVVSDSTLSLFNPVDVIKLICRASYPVQWFYNNEALNTSKIGKVPCGEISSSHKVYEAVLRISPLRKESTGNYTCIKTFHEEPSSYIYIYSVGDGVATFVNEGRHMQVIKDMNDPDPWVNLPCQVSNPTSKPYLFVDHEDSEFIQRLELSEKLKYNPTQGFRLHESLANYATTTFVCSMTRNASSFGVLITLHKRNDLHGSPLYSSDSSTMSGTGGSSAYIVTTIIMIILVIVLAVGLFIMYRKFREITQKTPDGHQLGNTASFSSYDDVRVQNDDRDNIVEGNSSYTRFS